MSNCNECLYDKDGICQSNNNPLDIEGNCWEFESKRTYNRGRADAISECLQIVQSIKDDYNDARFGEQIPINYGTLCGIIIAFEQLKEQENE